VEGDARESVPSPEVFLRSIWLHDLLMSQIEHDFTTAGSEHLEERYRGVGGGARGAR